jgi:major membrane immunogen (membrane-anchored lipoprotein)
MNTISIPGLIASLLLIPLLGACSGSASGEDKIFNGYYTAEAAAFDRYGWKEYITVFIDDNRIVTVEYDAKNAAGFLKSWDMAYLRRMNALTGNYPTKYIRAYENALLDRQDPAGIDALAGATESNGSFKLLAAAAINQARAGDKKVVPVELPPQTIRMGE